MEYNCIKYIIIFFLIAGDGLYMFICPEKFAHGDDKTNEYRLKMIKIGGAVIFIMSALMTMVFVALALT